MGHTISFNSIQPNNENIRAIVDFPQPQDMKQLQRFLGMENVYHKHIHNHAMIRRPLTNLLKKDVIWNWSDQCEKAFNKLKEELASKPILTIFDPIKPCIIYCDASQQGIGAVLKQKQANGDELLISYFSRKLLKHEDNYAITELECLAIVEADE